MRLPATSVSISSIRVALLSTLALGSLTACGSGEKPAGVSAPTADRVELTASQLRAVELGRAESHAFEPTVTAVGSIDFNEDRSVQVFTNYQGKIAETFAILGDDVKRGQPLYTIESPDLMQAASTLIATAGVFELTTKALTRAKALHEVKGLSDKDYEQTISDQMTADAAYKAARRAVAVFGKTPEEIDRMVAQRHVDPHLVVKSPVSGRVTARTAQVGLFVQPGNAPAPYVVSDLSSKWMLANVPETDAPKFHRGQTVAVKVPAYPDRVFAGTIAVAGSMVDPNVHTETLRTVIADPKNDLRPGMLANFVIKTGAAMNGVAVPSDGVAREGDGTMSVWTTSDDRHFVRKSVKVGRQEDGWTEILSGLSPGDRLVTKGAVFMSNVAAAAAGASS